jgi:hypothetical protein
MIGVLLLQLAVVITRRSGACIASQHVLLTTAEYVLLGMRRTAAGPGYLPHCMHVLSARQALQEKPYKTHGEAP